MRTPKKILVTGALGHIGSRLVRELDPNVVGKIRMIDNLESQRFCSLFNLPKTLAYEFIQADVRTADLAPLLVGVDAVVHLAAIANPEASHHNPEEAESVNLEGLKRVADACRVAGVALFFPSTTSVYGGESARVDETSTDLVAQSPYAKSKIEAEQYLAELGKKGLRYAICRFGTIFGQSVGMRFHTAVNKFIWQAVTKQPITVWKTAMDQKRPYLDLTDAVAAIELILNKDAFDGQLYNVVTHNLAVRDIIEAIKVHRPNVEMSLIDSPIMNSLSYEVDCSKIQQLGLTLRGDLSQGVAGTFALFQELT